MYGDILSIPAVAELANAPKISALTEGARPVRGILFDKLPGANWKVPWHQDVTIAVAEHHEVEGYGPWSVKNGVVHVQPPREILESMLAIRLHLDDCPRENGALKVIPGSHLGGKLGGESIDAWARRGEMILEVQAGDAILMKPLTLHVSSPSERPDHRRVIHIEYCSVDLPGWLAWAY